ncbi:MAG: helix-turn-helix transcriptional regulator [bacterium]
MQIHNSLSRILSEREVADRELAALTEMDAGHVNRIKNGRVVPSVTTALRLARALGLPVESLFQLRP